MKINFLIFLFCFTSFFCNANSKNDSIIYNQIKYLKHSKYPKFIVGSSIKVFEPKKKSSNRNYGNDNVFYSHNKNKKYYYEYKGVYLRKIDTRTKKVVDKIKIYNTSPCSRDVIPDGVLQLDGSNWPNVDFMLGVYKMANCCDDPETFYIIIDANGKLQLLLSIDSASVSYEGGWSDYNESYCIPEYPQNENLKYVSEYKINEEGSDGKIHINVERKKNIIIGMVKNC